MKKNARIVADDGIDRIEIIVKFRSRNGLVRHEVNHVVVQAVRKIFPIIELLPYVKMGAEATRIEI